MIRPSAPVSAPPVTPDAPLIVAGVVAHGPESRGVPGGVVTVTTRRSPAKHSPNEDAAAVVVLPGDRVLLVVADGCGGMPAGDVAARLAVETLVETCRSTADAQTAPDVPAAFDAANDAVLATRTGGATTLAAALLEPDGAGHTVRPYHAGDSTVLLTGQRGRIKIRTIAHAPTSYAVEAGLLSETEAMLHADRSIVSNVVGMGDMRIEIGPTVAIGRRDTLLLATDGLSDNVRPSEVVDRIRCGPLHAATADVVGAATERMHAPPDGDPSHADDMTIVVFRPQG